MDEHTRTMIAVIQHEKKRYKILKGRCRLDSFGSECCRLIDKHFAFATENNITQSLWVYVSINRILTAAIMLAGQPRGRQFDLQKRGIQAQIGWLYRDLKLWDTTG